MIQVTTPVPLTSLLRQIPEASFLISTLLSVGVVPGKIISFPVSATVQTELPLKFITHMVGVFVHTYPPSNTVATDTSS